jgi:hypothetical protein
MIEVSLVEMLLQIIDRRWSNGYDWEDLEDNEKDLLEILGILDSVAFGTFVDKSAVEYVRFGERLAQASHQVRKTPKSESQWRKKENGAK